MKFELRHTFDFPVEEVERVLFGEELLAILTRRMSTIIEIEALTMERTGDRLTRRIRYLPEPIIKSVGVKKVEPEWMEWVEESEYDYATHRGTFANIPARNRIAEVMKNHGTLTLRELPGGRCERVLLGELRVKVFVVGKIAERIIHSNAARILDEEAAILKEVLRNKEV